MRLKTGYLISGIVTGLIILISFIWTLPDGRLHVVFCDVGQGDAAYIRFPDGRDMLIDGGPTDAVIGCLGKYMPFWDRHINMVALTHPQKDHLQGLISVLERFGVDYFLKSDIANASDGYQRLTAIISRKKIPVRLLTQGEMIAAGSTSLSVLWPSEQQIAVMKPRQQFNNLPAGEAGLAIEQLGSNVLGTTKTSELNDGSLVILLQYGAFDVLFPGDADSHVESSYIGQSAADSGIEILKVPHHGSKTGMTDGLLQWANPKIAVISVGKNSYGHPSEEILKILRDKDIQIQRTDQNGDIEIVSDGRNWRVMSQN